MTKHAPGNALVAFTAMSAWDRKNTLKTGDEVIVSTGNDRIRLTITNTTTHQFTLDNGSRYSINSGKKIGSADSYYAPTILGIPQHTREEADRLNAAIITAAQEAEKTLALEELLDQALAIATERGVPLSEVFGDLHDLNNQRRNRAC